MDLRVSAVLLLVFITGGYALKCYTCIPLTGACDAKAETCTDGNTKCLTITAGSVTAKMCSPTCENTQFAGASIKCCDTDLCNAADGLSKSSFLLLFVPLLFYFLCQ